MASETIERLAQQFRTNRERFEAFCRLLSDEELAERVPGTPWTVHGYIPEEITERRA